MTIAFAVCVPGIIAGVGLFKVRNWARILTLIISVLNIFRIPIGTTLSIYAFWVLMKEETIQMLKGKAQASPLANPHAPFAGAPSDPIE